MSDRFQPSGGLRGTAGKSAQAIAAVPACRRSDDVGHALLWIAAAAKVFDEHDLAVEAEELMRIVQRLAERERPA